MDVFLKTDEVVLGLKRFPFDAGGPVTCDLSQGGGGLMGRKGGLSQKFVRFEIKSNV